MPRGLLHPPHTGHGARFVNLKMVTPESPPRLRVMGHFGGPRGHAGCIREVWGVGTRPPLWLLIWGAPQLKLGGWALYVLSMKALQPDRTRVSNLTRQALERFSKAVKLFLAVSEPVRRQFSTPTSEAHRGDFSDPYAHQPLSGV